MNKNYSEKIKEIIYIGLFAALICIAISIIKIPSYVTNGYVHLGDGFIFIAVAVLGKKGGAYAAGIGAMLADIMGGYIHYALPTLIIKSVMALIMGYIIEKNTLKNNKVWLLSVGVASLWQTIAYYVVAGFMLGNFLSPILEIPPNLIQSIIGIFISMIILPLVKKYSKLI